MFAKLAQHNFKRNKKRGNFQRALGRNPAAFRPCNDNQPARGAIPAQTLRHTRLFCRWHRTPSGTLECSWHSDLAASDASGEGISRLAYQCRDLIALIAA